jgi:putative ABC transport system substrate-binding protein
MRRVGVLIGAPETDPETIRRIAALVDNLRQLGWVEGRNVQFDYRISTEIARMRSFASEIVDLAPDIIVVHSNPFLANLRQVDRTIPTVFVQIADPVSSGFVESLARPGGNLTSSRRLRPTSPARWCYCTKIPRRTSP